MRENDLFFHLLRDCDPAGYAAHLADRSLFDECTLPDKVDLSSLSEVKRKWSITGKAHWIKRWFHDNASFSKGTTLHFPLLSKYGCHMDDAGNVCFPAKVFLKRFDAFAKYVFHESAHLWMAKQDYYPALLALDKAFTARYGKGQTAVCLSPVEHLASLLSVKLLALAAQQTEGSALSKRLLIQKDAEEAKLNKAITAFPAEK